MRPRFTRQTIFTYTQGECYALALALHDRTGWPVIAVSSDHVKHPVAEYTHDGVPIHGRWTAGFYHFAVRTPEGLALDVTGARPDPAMKRHWGAARVFEPEHQVEVLQDLRTCWQPVDGFDPIEMMRARDRRVAKRVLTLYAQQPIDFVPVSWWTLDPFSIGMDEGFTPDTLTSYRRLQDAGVIPKRVRCEYLIRDAVG